MVKYVRSAAPRPLGWAWAVPVSLLFYLALLLWSGLAAGALGAAGAVGSVVLVVLVHWGLPLGVARAQSMHHFVRFQSVALLLAVLSVLLAFVAHGEAPLEAVRSSVRALLDA